MRHDGRPMLHDRVSRTARSRLTSCCRVLRLRTAILLSGAAGRVSVVWSRVAVE
ncbi:hypothetical protein AK812_SmicGene31508, partial [Symbiodinium microadriaticum]